MGSIKALCVSGQIENAIVHHGTPDSNVAVLQKPSTADALARQVQEVIASSRLPAAGALGVLRESTESRWTSSLRPREPGRRSRWHGREGWPGSRISALRQELQARGITAQIEANWRFAMDRYFLGCSAEETAAIMQMSKATVDRDLRFIKGWLYGRLYPGAIPKTSEHSANT